MTPCFTRLAAALAACLALSACGTPPAGSLHAEASAAPIATDGITTASIAEQLYEIVHSDARQAVYVAAPAMHSDGAGTSHLLRLSPETLAIESRITLPYPGFGLALDDARARLYVGHAHHGAVSVIDLRTETVLATLPLMQPRPGAPAREAMPYGLRQLVLDTERQRLYLPGLAGRDSVLFVLDTDTLRLEKTLSGFGFQAVGIALDAQHDRIFVSNMQGQVMVVDSRTLTLRRTLEVQADQLINLAYDPVGDRLLGVDQGISRTEWRNRHLDAPYAERSPGHLLVALDPENGKRLASQPAGRHPLGLRLDSAHQRLYVTSMGALDQDAGDGALHVFDTAANRLLQHIALSPRPNSMALDARRGVLYVTIKNAPRQEREGTLERVARIPLRAHSR